MQITFFLLSFISSTIPRVQAAAWAYMARRKGIGLFLISFLSLTIYQQSKLDCFPRRHLGFLSWTGGKQIHRCGVVQYLPKASRT